MKEIERGPWPGFDLQEVNAIPFSLFAGTHRQHDTQTIDRADARLELLHRHATQFPHQAFHHGQLLPDRFDVLECVRHGARILAQRHPFHVSSKPLHLPVEGTALRCGRDMPAHGGRIRGRGSGGKNGGPRFLSQAARHRLSKARLQRPQILASEKGASVNILLKRQFTLAPSGYL